MHRICHPKRVFPHQQRCYKASEHGLVRQKWTWQWTYQKEDLPPFSCCHCKIVLSICTFCVGATEERLCPALCQRAGFCHGPPYLLPFCCSSFHRYLWDWLPIIRTQAQIICLTSPPLTQSLRRDTLHGMSQRLELSFHLLICLLSRLPH